MQDSPKRRTPLLWWRNRWRNLSPQKQDRLATLGPLLSVFLFLAAISSALTYFTLEERDREMEAVTRDVEYAQQRLRLRLLERQEQLMRIARDITNQELDQTEFNFQIETLVSQYPELLAVTWVNQLREVVTGYASPSAPPEMARQPEQPLGLDSTDGTFELARELRQTVYSRPMVQQGEHTIMLLVPLNEQGRFSGVLMAEYSVEALLRFGVPNEVLARYAVTLIDEQQNVLAGTPHTVTLTGLRRLPWAAKPQVHEMPVAPIGNSLILKAEGYRTSRDTMGEAFFWVVGAMSALTVWMLLGNMRHTRRRLQAQRALVAETNFRRAMENSMLTGMRALDLQGRITYVNAAFCEMTGWSESELVGATAPFPYWPEQDHELLMRRLEDELRGLQSPGGFQVRVKRKDGTLFDARMYVSPLIDATGKHTGWMTSMTDITEPNRIREQLASSHERFTIVLEALDASVSVAPLGSKELLFANKLYRQWFGVDTEGHLQLVERAGAYTAADSASGDVDDMVGLPTEPLTVAQAENAEVFVPTLDKWLEVRSRYINWADGRLAQMVIATDITPRRKAEELAAQQAERAQTASRLITMGEMASSVAHELNQPLTAISNYCNGMISRIKNQQIKEQDLLWALDKTAHQAQRAGQIIQRIRSFVKRSEPNRSQADVTMMVNEAVELAEIELRRRNVRLSHYVAARLPKLYADPILIEQVLINLMKNAAESIDNASRPAGQRHVELRVVPRTVDDQAAVEFSVSDTGKGLPPETMGRLYEAFFSTKAEGMGIGLNLCRSIIESHAGRIEAQNLYNADEVIGCRFSFWIPVHSATLPEKTTEVSP